jgi:intracellular multiplication protein IcmL
MSNESQAISQKLVDPAFLLGLVKFNQRTNLVLAAALLLFVGDKVWEAAHPPQPFFIYTDAEGKPYRSFPLNQQIMTDADVLNWTQDVVQNAYDINWRDYRTQLTQTSHEFTLPGWSSFGQSFIQTGDLDKLKQSRLVGDAQLTGAAVMVAEGVVGSVYTYQIQFPMTVTYANENQEITEHLNMNVIVVRAPAINHPNGIAIDQLNAVPQQ